MPDLCPKCHKNDSIRKITSIRRDVGEVIAGGPSGGLAMAGGKFIPVVGSTIISGTITTQLSALFQPPSKPAFINPGVATHYSDKSILLISAGVIVAIAGLVILVSIGGDDPAPVGLLVLTCGMGLVIYYGLIPHIKALNEVNPQAKFKFDAGYLRWEHKMEVFNRIYYCYTDDICFDPQNGNIANPSEYWTLYP